MMQLSGHILGTFLLLFYFRKAEPKDTVIKIDYRRFKSKNDFEDYIVLFKDSGWEHIAGTKSSGTQYFKKVNECSSDDIFSDVPSKAARYKRLSNMWFSIIITYIPILLVLIITNTIKINEMLNPKLLYYTPGLWQMSGIQFWLAFLFETPFALYRGFAWLAFPILIIMFSVFALKAEKYYRRSL